MNFYAVLGVPLDADEETIRSAYRILARRYHPDRGEGSSTEKFRQVSEAYETLADRGRREVYDLTLPQSRRRAALRAEPLAPRVIFRENPQVFGRFENQRLPLVFDEMDEWIERFFRM